MGKNTYYKEDTVADGVFTKYDFGSSMQGIIVVNRGLNDIEFSFNGQDVDSKLQVADFREVRDNIDEASIYVRGVGGPSDIEIRAWRGQR